MIKYHKIRNIDMEVCTAEQKIAYNIAFSVHINYGDRYLAATPEKKEELLQRIIGTEVKNFEEVHGNKRYAIDGIRYALENGLANYLEKFFIASNYEIIGENFPKAVS